MPPGQANFGSVRTFEDLLKILHSNLEGQGYSARPLAMTPPSDTAERGHRGAFVGTCVSAMRPTASQCRVRALHQCEEALDELCSAAPSPVDLTAAKDDCEAMASYLNDRAS